jgi:ubiquitin C-terminal hydrolase
MTEENDSNKRQTQSPEDEETDNQEQSSKIAKYDSSTFQIEPTENIETIEPIQELSSNFYISRTKVSYISGVWKIDIPLSALNEYLFNYEVIKRSETLFAELSLLHCTGEDKFELTIQVADTSIDSQPEVIVDDNDYSLGHETPVRDNTDTESPLRNSPESANSLDMNLKGKPVSQLTPISMDEYYNIKLNIFVGGMYYTDSFSYVKPNCIKRKEFFCKPTSDFSIIVDIDIAKVDNRNTDCLGLINEGMTCYMNSMLQTLNLFGYLKKALFKLPLDINDRTSLPYSLCKLFYDLVNEDKPISTGKLISSFGWSKEDVLVQHDVQEFNLKLSEFLENKMKGTEAEGTFAYLFQGKIKTFIECLNVVYKSEKEENFNDISLTIKGCKTIYDSFTKYTEEEILNGNDQYYAEGFGKQDAKKGLRFIKLPNVLILQLKRFEYNPTTYMLEKINDRFEYYDQIDLNDFVSEHKDSIYTLYSVLVHSGSVNYGHYYCYCKVKNKWIKFNDTNVKFADAYEVFENNYGGNYQIHRYINKAIRTVEMKSDSNAYVLVYIKDSVKATILSPITNEDVI